MMRAEAGNGVRRQRRKRAGNSLRAARSPVPPKTTRSNGGTVLAEEVDEDMSRLDTVGAR
jgi:hypothetical protein